MKHGMNFRINVHQNKVEFFETCNAIFAKPSSSNSHDTLIQLMKTHF